MFCGLVDEDLSSSKSVLPSAIVEAHASNVESRWAPKKQNLLLTVVAALNLKVYFIHF